MKNLIFFLLVFFPEFAKACANKIDPSKVMLFIDTNNSELEIATTQKAACARGESLVVVPKNYKDYNKFSLPVETLSKKVGKLKCYEKAHPGCDEAQKQLRAAFNKLDEFRTSQKPTSESVAEALSAIKASKGKLTNLSISGHDGGGSFSGTKGNYSRQELSKTMKDFSDINEVKSLLLLGCYTGTQSEVIEWRNIFPQTKLIAGYDGSAPLADRPQGHQYISDILTKEKKLSALADQKKLQAYLDANLASLGKLNSALFLQCSDGSSTHEYYYGSKKSKKIQKFDIKDCIEKKQELSDLETEIEKYATGELEPPADTQNGPLRAIYNKARALEHCADVVEQSVDVNSAFNLLFYEGVKSSFAKYYENDLKQAEDIFAEITPAEMEKNFRTNQEKEEKSIAEYDAMTALLESNPTEYFAIQDKEVQVLKAKSDAILNDPKNADIKAMLEQSITGMGGGMGVGSSPTNEAQWKRYNEALAAHYKYDMKKREISIDKLRPSDSMKMKKENSEMRKDVLRNRESSFLFLKEKLKDPKNKFWVPTGENLKKYSRKELMDKTHLLNAIMMAGVLNPKQSRAMNWVNSVQSTHLEAFQNPFSWHEYTGHVQKPPYPTPKLSTFLEGNSDSLYGGMSGGYAGGIGGGY